MAATPQRRTPRGGGGVPDGALVGFLAVLLGSVALVWLATGIGGALQHGSWPHIKFAHTGIALRRLIGEPADVEHAWSHPDPVPDLPSARAFWTILVVLIALLMILVVFVLLTWSRWRAATRAPARTERIAGATGTATRPHATEPATEQPAPAATPPSTAHHTPAPDATANGSHPLSAQALLPRARTIRPDIPVIGRSLHDVLAYGFALGHDTAGDTDLYAGLDHTVCVYGPPGSAATARLVHGAVRTAPGPALTTCSSPDALRATLAVREKLGPTLVFDPLQLTDVTQRLRWSPVQGCENPAVADTRARALLEPVRPLARTQPADQHGQRTARLLLRCWLHAAALDSRPVRQVLRWANGQGGREAVTVLLRSADQTTEDWAGALDTLLTGPPALFDAARALTARALECLQQLHVLNSCNPSPSETLRLESFLEERGTIYVVGETMEARSSRDLRMHPGTMPLLTALVEDVVEHGRRMAARSSSGRLDPPMLCALDDIAGLAPAPVLPTLMSVGGDIGLPTLAVLRSPEQARHRWGDDGAATIHQSANVRVRVNSPNSPAATVQAGGARVTLAEIR